jgi:hypothetical protein
MEPDPGGNVRVFFVGEGFPVHINYKLLPQPKPKQYLDCVDNLPTLLSKLANALY